MSNSISSPLLFITRLRTISLPCNMATSSSQPSLKAHALIDAAYKVVKHCIHERQSIPEQPLSKSPSSDRRSDGKAGYAPEPAELDRQCSLQSEGGLLPSDSEGSSTFLQLDTFTCHQHVRAWGHVEHSTQRSCWDLVPGFRTKCSRGDSDLVIVQRHHRLP